MTRVSMPQFAACFVPKNSEAPTGVIIVFAMTSGRACEVLARHLRDQGVEANIFEGPLKRVETLEGTWYLVGVSDVLD